MTHPQANQWRASKLVGVNIYGADHQKIGDVNDVLVDHQGKAEAVVIGVGGFLGIGEKDVAVPFSAIQWRENRDDLQTASTNRPAGAGGAGTGAGGASGTTATTGAGTGNMASTSAGGAPTAGTGAGSTASSTTASNTAAGTSASNTSATGSTNRSATNDRDRGYPDHGVLNMSKADLQNAPKFSYNMNDNSSASGSRGTGASGTSTSAPAAGSNAPKQ